MNIKSPLAVVLALGFYAGTSFAATTYKTKEDQASYSLGQNIGASLQSQKLPIKLKSLIQGITDAWTNAPPKVDKNTQTKALESLRQDMMKKMIEERKKIAEDQQKAGEAYLNKNAHQSGVTTTTSGIQYQVITAGKGELPTDNDSVAVHYSGQLVDGTVFDSNSKESKPAEFCVNQVIPGLNEALKLMTPGAEWKIVIPSSLAYGKNGIGPNIPPNATLVFDITLISSKKDACQPPATPAKQENPAATKAENPAAAKTENPTAAAKAIENTPVKTDKPTAA